jgi:hypothetical protein
MILNSEWNPAKIYNELVSWLNQQGQEQFMFQDPQRTLNSYLSGKSVSSGEISVAMTQLSYWYSVHAAIGLFEKKGSAIQHMHQSFLYEAYNILLKIAWLEEKKRKGNFIKRKIFGESQPRFSFMDHGLILAKGFTLGCFRETELLGKYTLSELTEDSFYGLHSTVVTPFVLSLFCQWKSLLLPPVFILSMQKDFYQKILERWRSSNLSDLENYLVKACDFHITRSRENTNKETFEFSNPVYSIYPVEILTVLRLREELNLQLPEIDHPLMKTPLGKLYRKEKIPKDLILERLKTEIDQKLRL